MKTEQALRSSATSRQRQLVEHLKRATKLAERLNLNSLDPRDMNSLRSTLDLSNQAFHEFSAYSNALLTGDAG